MQELKRPKLVLAATLTKDACGGKKSTIFRTSKFLSNFSLIFTFCCYFKKQTRGGHRQEEGLAFPTAAFSLAAESVFRDFKPQRRLSASVSVAQNQRGRKCR